MKEIKLLIADDEENIRNALCNIIDWKKIHVDICGIAKDGKEALEKIHQLEPDIVLMDIRMPFMTGLEVLEVMKKEKLRIKTIMLSGFDEFAYARTAIANGAVNYLLKPCRPEHIMAAVIEVKEEIIKELEKSKKTELLNMELESSRYEVKNKWIADLILTTNEQMVEECVNKIGYEIKRTAYCFVIHPTDDTLFFRNQQQAIIDYIEGYIDSIAGSVAENIIVIANGSDENDKKKLRDILIKVKNFISNNYTISVSVGVGNVVNRSKGLKESYQNALRALDMVHFIGTDFIIFYDSIYGTNDSEYPVPIEEKIFTAIKQKDIDECNQRIDEFFQVASNQDTYGIIKNAIAMLLSLYHYTILLGLKADDIFGKPLELMENIQKCKSKEELAKRIKSQCSLMIGQLENHQTGNPFVNAAKMYINKNYMKDITLSTVANEIYITSGYLSTLFKQVTGDSFVNYLNKVRIDHACELLKDVRLKTYEVAYLVGFQDEKYFTRVFKKLKGHNPSQYKKHI